MSDTSTELSQEQEQSLKKFLSLRVEKKSKSNASIDFDPSSISSADTEYTNSTSSDLADIERSLDQTASANVQKVIDDSYRAFASFDKFNKLNIYRYFYKTNPILGRSIDLHVDLPLSKIRLTPPKNTQSELVKDYIYHFYETVFSKIDLFSFLRDFILHYRIYGEVFALVEDNYNSTAEALELCSPEKLSKIFSSKVMGFTPEQEKEMAEIESKYSTDSKLVSSTDRLKYLKIAFPNFNKNYSGIDRISVIDFYKIDQYYKNYSSNYRALSIKVDPKLSSNLNQIPFSDLEEFGITESFYDLLSTASERTIDVDNNPYKTKMNTSYVFEMGYDKSQTSLIHRVIDQAFEYEALKAAVRTKINLVGKVGRIITSEGIGEDQLKVLQAEIEYMNQNPDSEIVLNFPIEVNEFNTTVKDDLNSLISDYERLKEEISMGLGIPLSLIGGESQFSGEVIRLEIMNNEYLNFKNTLSRIIEDYILKPIAVRKGFYQTNEWGEVELIYPSVSFSRTSLRSESQYDLLFSMYSKGSLPSDIIYDLLNIDPESVAKSLKKEIFSIKNPNMGELINRILSDASTELGQTPEIINRVKEALGLTFSKEEKSQDPEHAEERLGDLKKYSVEDTYKKYQRPDLKKNINPETLKKLKKEDPKHKIKQMKK